MTRLAIAFGLCLLAVGTAAQESGIAISAGPARIGFNAERLGLLTDTYTTRYAARLRDDIALIPEAASGMSGSVAYRLVEDGAVLGIGYEYGRASTDARSVFENGSGDRVQTETVDHSVYIELMGAVMQPLAVGVTGRIGARSSQVTAATVYPDGFESLGTEYRINGVYREAGQLTFGVGLAARVRLTPWLALPARATLDFTPGDGLGLGISDDAVQGGNNTFPVDFERWLADDLGLDTAEASLQPEDLRGLRLQIGLELVPSALF